MRDLLVATVRGYIGTPFHHQGRLPGVGLDCAGVGVCGLQDCQYPVQDQSGYGRIPTKGMLQQAILNHCDLIPLSDVLPGDFLLFAFRDEPQHIAVVSNITPMRIVHSYSEVGQVVENDLDELWQQRLRGCYRLKELE